MFKAGDLVKILNIYMESDLGIIIEQGKNPCESDPIRITTAEWLVHLSDGRRVWLFANEIANV